MKHREHDVGGRLAFVALFVVAGACTSPIAVADALQLRPSGGVELSLFDVQADAGSADGATAASAAMEAPPADRAWGTKGTWTLNLTGGYADDFDDIGVVPFSFGVSWFLIDDFSVDLQAEAGWISQPGDDAFGGGLAMMLRWHFLHFGTKGGIEGTLYGDIGIGFLAVTEPVPTNAGDIVFTPRAGMGASWVINDRTRLLTGVRWFHISNAQTARENPGVNGVQLYAGLSFAF